MGRLERLRATLANAQNHLGRLQGQIAAGQSEVLSDVCDTGTRDLASLKNERDVLEAMIARWTSELEALRHPDGHCRNDRHRRTARGGRAVNGG